MPENVVAFIRTYHTYSAEVILQMARSIPESLWESAQIIGGMVNKDLRSCGTFALSACVEKSPDLKFADAALFDIFTNALQHYIQDLDKLGRFVVEAGVSEDEGYSFLRYLPGEFYTLHVDNNTRKLPRTLSGVLVLNNDYEGGELCFPVQGLTLKPIGGTVVLFPSSFTHPHQVRPITSGVRYSVVTWFK